MRSPYKLRCSFPDADRPERTEKARDFFEAIKNPPEPSPKLKAMVERYGKYALRDSKG